MERDTDISADTIADIPYANALVTINDTQPILMILAFADVSPVNNRYQLTWLANDLGSITTEQGRIVHTTGFTGNNLEQLAVDLAPSVPLLPNVSTVSQWQARYDWSPGYRYGFNASVVTQSLGMDVVTTELWQQDAEHIIETVTFDDIDAQFTNHFWLVEASATLKPYVVKSIQYLGPNMNKVEMVMTRPFVELQPTTTASNNNGFLENRNSTVFSEENMPKAKDSRL